METWAAEASERRVVTEWDMLRKAAEYVAGERNV